MTCRYIDYILNIRKGDSRYEEILADKEGVSNMCDVAQRLEDRGIQKGIKQGIQKGRFITGRSHYTDTWHPGRSEGVSADG